ncbi:MAG TPA: serine hydrolase domain-containing protein [Polyangiaceae bacterium]|nr:serine hydrolase domain-containing protein [Polyangiaceae bacterium]
MLRPLVSVSFVLSASLLGALSGAACTPSAANGGAAPANAAATPPEQPSISASQPDSIPAAAATTPGSLRPTEAALRKLIATLQRGESVADLTSEALAHAVEGPFRADVVGLGEVESMALKTTDAEGMDVYEVTSKTGFSAWRIKLGPDGKTEHLLLRVLEKPPERALTEAEFGAALEQRLMEQAAKDEFSGVVLVARDGKPIFQRAIGLADREQGIPNQLETKFRIGSMNKMFTAVSVLQLVQAGKLSLSDPLGKWLKDYPNAEVAQQVTIEHLLTHTGGTGDIFGPEYQEHKAELRTHSDFVKLLGQRGLAFPPGTQWAYSNYGFVLLGAVIEKVTGQSYYDYVAQHVYAPAGMKNSGSFPEDQKVPLRSLGYTRFRSPGAPATPGAKWFSNAGVLGYRGSAAGGGYSTAADLLAFAQALEQHRLLDAEHTELLTTAKPGPAANAHYAYGFSDETMFGVRCIGHGGGAPGMNSDLLICQPPEAASPFVIVTLANLDPPIANRFTQFVRARLPTGTAATARASSGACRDLVLDDLDDGDDRSLGSPGASGRWTSFKDPNGTTLSPEPFESTDGGARGSKRAAHIAGKTGGTRATWATVGVEAGSTPYDLSPWARVCFRAKGSGRARFNVPDVNTTPEGGVCKQCYNNFGAGFALTASWQEHCFRFDELTQVGRWGEALPAVVPEKVYALSWSTHEPNAAYDLWVDDVRLVCQ